MLLFRNKKLEAKSLSNTPVSLTKSYSISRHCTGAQVKAQETAETPIPQHSTVMTLHLMLLCKTIYKEPSQQHMKSKSSLPLQSTSNRDHLLTSIYSD